MLLEVCVETERAAREAQRRGAGRLELSARLDLGGLTPAPELRDAVLGAAGVPVHVMIRPRAGGFVYDAAEFATMCRQAEQARAAGAAGLVFGLLDGARRVDAARTADLVARSRPCAVTFHRAFDALDDQLLGLDVLAELGIERVLTSGGAPTAREGAARLRRLVEHAAGRLVVVAGGGVRRDHAAALVAATGVTELHASVPFALDG